MSPRVFACLLLASLFLRPVSTDASAPSASKHASRHAAKASTPPKAARHPIATTYWGTKVIDDFQYLERPGDPAVERWARGQDSFTRAWLSKHPERRAIANRIVHLTHSNSPDYYGAVARKGRVFLMKEEPPKEQPFLVTVTSPSDLGTERTIVDPNAIDTSGGTSIDFYTPSLDGRFVAISLSKNGTEDGTLYFYETETDARLPDSIPRVNGGTAGGSATWNADASGVYYTRYPAPGERPEADLPFYQQIYFHKLGTPVRSDRYVLGREFPKIAEIQLSTSLDGRHVLADVSNGDGGEHAYWLLSPAGSWSEVTRFEDGITRAMFGPDGALYLLSRAGAPHRKILRLELARPRLSEARILIPETEQVIEGFTPTATRIYVREMVGGPTQIRAYTLKGKALGLISWPEVAIMGEPVRVSGDDVLIRSQSYTHPPAYYSYRAEEGTLKRTSLAQTSPANFSDCEVRREFATADDGTHIPISILMRKGTRLDGRSPLLLYGYGSYGVSEQPYFQPELKAWLEQGGIWADASVRGGGEYGESWHRAARLGTKKVSMDDFAACARYLIEKRYTSKERLAIQGGSAGGLLVYGTLVHHPDVMEAAVAQVGYGDVLRTELAPNGEFNTTEFGMVRDSAQFRGMLSYSPYHHVRPGTRYPSVLATTGVNDPRVPSWETYKMVARLQASGMRNPVLMRVSYKTGHGIGTSLSERDQELADVFLFLFDRLGVSYRPVTTPAEPAAEPPNP
jgi:prolyl oligopeptidase